MGLHDVALQPIRAKFPATLSFNKSTTLKNCSAYELGSLDSDRCVNCGSGKQGHASGKTGHWKNPHVTQLQVTRPMAVVGVTCLL